MTDVGTTYNAAKATVEDALMNYLEEWRPAITVFPWPYADQEPSYANQMPMVSKYSSELVQPATGFDNGAMIFHESIVDFFIPIWLGKGWEPRFTVQVNFASTARCH